MEAEGKGYKREGKGGAGGYEEREVTGRGEKKRGEEVIPVKMFWILVLMMATTLAAAEEAKVDIVFVGTVERVEDSTLLVRVGEVLATDAESVCPLIRVKGGTTPASVGESVHVRGYYDAATCEVTVETEDHFVYKVPEGATLERLSQSLQCSGKITRIYEMRGETFCDISVKDVYMVTFQQKEMCMTITVRIKPAVGEVEEGLKPGDKVEFSGAYDENGCMGSLGWHDDYLRKQRGLGVSWVLVLGGFAVYVMMRKM